jgi:hypothetical protein
MVSPSNHGAKAYPRTLRQAQGDTQLYLLPVLLFHIHFSLGARTVVIGF